MHETPASPPSSARRSTATARARGPDLELLREVRERFGGRVLAAGGIRDAADVEAVRELGLDGVVVGRAWLDGTLIV